MRGSGSGRSSFTGIRQRHHSRLVHEKHVLTYHIIADPHPELNILFYSFFRHWIEITGFPLNVLVAFNGFSNNNCFVVFLWKLIFEPGTSCVRSGYFHRAGKTQVIDRILHFTPIHLSDSLNSMKILLHLWKAPFFPRVDMHRKMTTFLCCMGDKCVVPEVALRMIRTGWIQLVLLINDHFVTDKSWNSEQRKNVYELV